MEYAHFPRSRIVNYSIRCIGQMNFVWQANKLNARAFTSNRLSGKKTTLYVFILSFIARTEQVFDSFYALYGAELCLYSSIKISLFISYFSTF